MKKTTSDHLSKRLKHYGALSLAVAGAASAGGQIVHHALDPIIEGTNNYFLNLNPNDGITPGGVADIIDDFRIFVSYSSVPSLALIRVEALNGNSILATSGGIGVYPFALASSYAVSNSNTNWDNTQFQSLVVYSSCLYGNWCTANDLFLGLRFKIDGNTHFGWAKMDADAATLTWKLKEFAFNATPDEPIDTGQTTLGISDNAMSEIKITTLHKSIGLYNLPESTDYRLYSMSGQSVLKGNTNERTHVIETNTLATGIYIIELKDQNSGATLKKKIVL